MIFKGVTVFHWIAVVLLGLRRSIVAADVAAAAAAPPAAAVVHSDDDDFFDPALQLEDYALLLPPSSSSSSPIIISEKWLTSCANTLANDTTIVKPFPTGIHTRYRLGDCVRLCDGCFNYDDDNNNDTSKRTMASLYGETNCPCSNNNNNNNNNLRSCSTSATRRNDPMNLTRLEEILQFYSNSSKTTTPDPNAVVLHLRLGDVIESQPKSVSELLVHGGTGMHLMSLQSHIPNDIRSVQQVLDILQQADELINVTTTTTTTTTTAATTKLIIVGGSHVPQAYRKSRVYANCLARGVAKASAGRRVVELHLDDDRRGGGGDADQDFYFMSHSKFFVESTGGYSMLIGLMAKRLGAIHTWNFESEYKEQYYDSLKNDGDHNMRSGVSWAANLEP